MRRRLTVLDPRSGIANDLVAELLDEATVADFVATAGVAIPADEPLYLGPRCLDATDRLDALGLVDGTVLSVGQPGPVLVDERDHGIEVRVVSGPDAGRVVPLAPGTTVAVGRAPEAQVRLADRYLGRAHATLHVDAAGAVTLTNDRDAATATRIEGTPVPPGTATPLGLGQFVETGASMWTLAPVTGADAALSADKGGGITYNRQPRIRPDPPDPVSIDWPKAPDENANERPPIPWIGILLPLVAAVGMAVMMQQPRFLMFAVMSPLMIGGNLFSERGQRSRRAKRDHARYASDAAHTTARLDAAISAQRTAARAAGPDPATLLLTLVGPRRGLWARRPTHDDHLLLRVGLAPRPAQISVKRGTSRDADERPVLNDVPVCLPLEALGVIGIAGPQMTVRGVARALALQVIALQSPDDVRLVVLTDPGAEADWGWLPWAPHGALEGSPGVTAIGNTIESVDARVKELSKLLTQRQSIATDQPGAINVPLPRIVVVLDGANLLRRQPGVPQLLANGPGVGIYVICLDESENLLPEECNGAVVVDAASADGAPAVTGCVARSGHEALDAVLLDQVAAPLLAVGARRIAPISRISGDDITSSLPSRLRLLDVLDLEPPEAERIAQHWRTSKPTTRAVVGRTVDGLGAIDIKVDGPHGVVAGTTGAGKSEFLLSLISSLAYANRPEDLNFVLVDYKGGAAFKDTARLPHTVGMVTNLQGHLTDRVRISLKAEIDTRQRILATLGATDIDDYHAKAARRTDESPIPLPRLLIVFDEFAQLVREAPAFVDALMGVAAVGRSLGMHLILATQKPGGGVVTPQIRANAPLSIALRVADTGESDGVISAPDAARISKDHPGRLYVRIGTEPLVLMQSGRIAGPRPSAAKAIHTPRVFVRTWEQQGWPEPNPPGTGTTSDDEETDLEALVAAMNQAWQDLGPVELRKPWLEPLPAILTLDEVALDPGSPPELVPFGLEDFPAEQRQAPVAWDLRVGPLVIAGGPRSGKSLALRTLAVSAARRLGPDRTNLYAFDCGTGSLLCLSRASFCGAVIQRHEPDRAVRLITRLLEVVSVRQSQLAANGWSSIQEQWQAADRTDHLPYHVVLIDKWEGFLDAFGDHAEEAAVKGMHKLLAEGPSAGVVVAMAGDRRVLSTAISSVAEQRFALRLAERDEYTTIGLNPRAIPKDVTPGQAFRADAGTEVRVALLDRDPSGPAQSVAVEAALAALAAPRGRSSDREPLRVDSLPTSIAYADAVALAPPPVSGFPALLGVGGDRLTSRWVDLAADAPTGVAVLGPKGMGRSTALATMARSIVDTGGAVILVAAEAAPFGCLDGHARVIARFGRPDDAGLDDLLRDHVGNLAVVIDNATSFPQDHPGLVGVIDSRRADRRILVSTSTEEVEGLYSGIVPSVLKGASIILLSPKNHYLGTSFGMTLPRGTGFSGPPGRGFLRAGGEPALIQVPNAS